MSFLSIYLFLLLLLLISITYSSIHIAPNRNQLQYSSIRKSLATDSFHREKRRTISENFQIYISYDKSVEKLRKDEQKFIKNAVQSATDYWSKVIRPKYHLNHRIRLTRQCPSRKMFIVANDFSIHFCSEQCLNETRCGDIVVPDEHLQQCHVCKSETKCEPIGKKGAGVDGEFILYVSAIETSRCLPVDTLATASFCQLEPEKDRPIAGNINICPKQLSGAGEAIDFDRLVSTIKHEILHTLVFSSGLFAFFRDSNGQPYTVRDNATRWPKNYDEKLQVYTPSEQVLKKIVRQNWQIRGGTIDREVSMLVTPKVQEIVREHFACPTLEGAELEDQGSAGTALTHWEKRLFEHEIMTGTYTQESIISNLTLALLEDSGWYDVSYEYGKPLLWGRKLGCDFVKNSCKQWIDSKLQKHQSPYPFCISIPKSSLFKRTCAYTHDKLVMCNLVEYSTPLPVQYQNFDFLPNVTNEHELGRYGGHVMLADYCPYHQELSFKNPNRDSRCYRSENQPTISENFALEKYSPESKCFDHGSTWEQYIEQCRRKRRINPQHAGCYQYQCLPSEGISIHIGEEKYLCQYTGQILSIAAMAYNTIYNGTIVCPDCQVICGSLENFECPKRRSFYHKQRNTQLTVNQLCQKHADDKQSSMSDTIYRINFKILFLILFVLFVGSEKAI